VYGPEPVEIICWSYQVR